MIVAVVELLVGPAVETLPAAETFGLAFIDADGFTLARKRWLSRTFPTPSRSDG